MTLYAADRLASRGLFTRKPGVIVPPGLIPTSPLPPIPLFVERTDDAFTFYCCFPARFLSLSPPGAIETHLDPLACLPLLFAPEVGIPPSLTRLLGRRTILLHTRF